MAIARKLELTRYFVFDFAAKIITTFDHLVTF
jgi:hypothetical protein